MPFTPPPQIPNFNPTSPARIATDRYDFEAHLEGVNPPLANAPKQNFRHNATQTDLLPDLTINNIFCTTVQEALQAINSNLTPNISLATTSAPGIIQLGGDLNGTNSAGLAPKVGGLQGRPIANLAPTIGQVLTWSGSYWGPATPTGGGGGSPTGPAGGDLGGTYPNPVVNQITGTVGGTLNIDAAGNSSTINIGTGGAGPLIILGNGVASVQIPNLGVGVVHSNASGFLSSSLLNVVTDITPGTPGQALFTNGSPNAFWTGFSGDVSSSSTPGKLTVTGIQGHPVSATAPTTGQVLEYNGTDYVPTTLSGSFSAGGDLTGSSTNQTVVGLQTHAVPTPTGTGTVLTWTGSAFAWDTGGGGPPTGAAGGDLGGTYPDPTVDKITGNTGGIVPISDPVTIGLNTAVAGSLRIGNNTSISARNAANNADISLVTADGSNDVIIANTTSSVVGDIILGFGSTGATMPVVISQLGGHGPGYVAASNTGLLSWSAGAAPSGAAGGDLTGTYPNPTIHSIQGVVISGTPTTGQVLTATSAAAADWATPGGGPPSGAAGGDLSGTYPNPRVTGLNGVALPAPSSFGQALFWSGSSYVWDAVSVTGPASGDLSGAYPDPTVVGLHGNSIPIMSGFNTVLTWTGSAFAWDASGGGGFTAGGDLAGTSTSQTVDQVTGAVSGIMNIAVSSASTINIGTGGAGPTINIGNAEGETVLNGALLIQNLGTTILSFQGDGITADNSGSISVATPTVTLTSTQYQYMLIVLTGEVGAVCNVVFPNINGLWLVDMSTVTFSDGGLNFVSGSATVTVATSSTIPTGASQMIVWVRTTGSNGIGTSFNNNIHTP